MKREPIPEFDFQKLVIELKRKYRASWLSDHSGVNEQTIRNYAQMQNPAMPNFENGRRLVNLALSEFDEKTLNQCVKPTKTEVNEPDH